MAGMRPAFVLLTALRLASAGDVAIESYFPSGTKAVIGIRLDSLNKAGLFQGIDGEVKKTAAGLLQKMPLAGFDPFKDLDEVIIATTGDGEKPPTIAVLRGKFPIEKIPQDAPRYRDFPIIGGANGLVALIDGSTAIAGEPAEVQAAIDHRESPASGAWLSRGEALRSQCAIWGIGEGLEKAGAPAGQPGGLPPIDRFEFGASFNQGLRLAAEIQLGSAADAEKFAASLRLVEAMIKTPNRKSPKGPGFDLRVEKQTVKFSMIVPESELKQAVAEERGMLL